jgi:small conductance mechanosensitive channel
VADPTPEQLEQACGATPSWVCRKVYESSGSDTWAHVCDWIVAKPLTILLIVLIALIVNAVLRRSIKRVVSRLTATSSSSPAALVGVPPVLLAGRARSARREARAHTLGSVLRSSASIVVWVTALFAVFGVLDINLGPLIAGAGIAGIAIGFGAQSLVKDVVSGVFMLAEDQYGVGDIVDLGEASGTVEKVSIRSTRLRDVFGVVWYVPNGEIRRVANKSQEWARALLDVTVAYDTDVAAAERVIREVADEVAAEPEWAEDVLDPPEVWGIEGFGPNGIAIRLVIKTRPDKQYALMRELRRRLKDALDEAGVALAFEQAMRINWRAADEPPGGRDHHRVARFRRLDGRARRWRRRRRGRAADARRTAALTRRRSGTTAGRWCRGCRGRLRPDAARGPRRDEETPFGGALWKVSHAVARVGWARRVRMERVACCRTGGGGLGGAYGACRMLSPRRSVGQVQWTTTRRRFGACDSVRQPPYGSDMTVRVSAGAGRSTRLARHRTGTAPAPSVSRAGYAAR